MKLHFDARVDKVLSFFSTENSFTFVTEDRLRIDIDQNFGLSLVFNESSIYYDGEKLLLMMTGFSPFVITNKGSLVIPQRDGIELPVIVSCDGNVYECNGDTLVRVDVDGRKFRRNADGNFEEVPVKHAKVVEVGTGMTTVVRPDNIRLTIDREGNRKFDAVGDISITHGIDGKISIDIPDGPVTTKSEVDGEDMLDFVLSRYTVKMKSSGVDVSCDDFSFVAANGAIDLTIGENQCHLTFDRYEFRHNEQVLVACQDGTERMGHLTTEKPKNRKIELIASTWGDVAPPQKPSFTEQEHLDLHKLFRPRFFCLRRDDEAFEFCRMDDMDFSQRKVYENQFKSQEGEVINIITTHELETKPDFFFHVEPLSKVERANLIKSVHPDKIPKKLQPGDIEAIKGIGFSAIENFHDSYATFSRIVESVVDEAEQQYEIEVIPPPPPPPEQLPIPPQTPAPRLMMMQKDAYEKCVGDTELDYWNSHESDFGYPLDRQRRDETPLSPRTKLCDPPRQPDKYPLEVEVEQPRAVSTMRRRQTVPEEKPRPQTAQTNRKSIDFGEVKVGETKRMVVSVKNTGLKPLHFICPLMKSPMLRVLTVSGLISPGLVQKIRLELAPKVESTVQDTLIVRTPLFELKIPVSAQVVKNDMPDAPEPAKTPQSHHSEEDSASTDDHH